MAYHASKAVAAVERSDPDWKLGRSEWIKADTLAMGRIPGQPTQFPLVHVQKGYNDLVEELTLHPENYEQYKRDYPGLIEALSTMSRFAFLEGREAFESGRLELALEKFGKVLGRDTRNFSTADRILREYTGRGIRETTIRNFWQRRYRESFESERGNAYMSITQELQRIAEAQGEEMADSLMESVAGNAGGEYRASAQQMMDWYYYSSAYQEGNLPEYLRIWRPQVLEGQKPLKVPFFRLKA